MIGNIEHNNGTMTVTTKGGDVAKRKTNVPYTVAIVGRQRNGKLVIRFASTNEAATRATFASIPGAEKGSAVACKFQGLADLELVTVDAGWIPGDQAEMEARDSALIAATRARRAA